MWRRNLLICGAAVLVLSACRGGAGASEILREGEIERGTIEATVSATGSISPSRIVNLGFEQPGVVDEILVEAGEVVSEGDPLAVLDASVPEVAVQQAELAVRTQELLLEQLSTPPSESQLAQAEATVASAWANYNRIAQGADPETAHVAQLEYEQAWTLYLEADMRLRATQALLEGDILIQTQAQVDQAAMRAEMARLQLEQARADPDQYGLTAAWAQVAQAQAQLDGLRAGPSNEEIAQAETRLEQAQVGLERAQQALEAATLRAPFDGIVAEINLHVGQLPPTVLPAVVLIDNSQFYIEVEVDEIDIGLVAPGQPVKISLDALEDTVLSGVVADIAPAASGTVGVVTYTVRIDLDSADAPLREGMTATTDIIVERVEDTLLVPNWAIRYDRETGQALASVLISPGRVEERPVELGLRGETHSQVLSGLEEGDRVAVSLERESLREFVEE